MVRATIAHAAISHTDIAHAAVSHAAVAHATLCIVAGADPHRRERFLATLDEP